MVIVAGHIPPGVFFGKTDWQPWAQKRYIEVTSYVMVVINIINSEEEEKETI